MWNRRGLWVVPLINALALVAAQAPALLSKMSNGPRASISRRTPISR